MSSGESELLRGLIKLMTYGNIHQDFKSQMPRVKYLFEVPKFPSTHCARVNLQPSQEFNMKL